MAKTLCATLIVLLLSPPAFSKRLVLQDTQAVPVSQAVPGEALSPQPASFAAIDSDDVGTQPVGCWDFLGCQSVNPIDGGNGSDVLPCKGCGPGMYCCAENWAAGYTSGAAGYTSGPCVGVTYEADVGPGHYCVWGLEQLASA